MHVPPFPPVSPPRRSVECETGMPTPTRVHTPLRLHSAAEHGEVRLCV